MAFDAATGKATGIERLFYPPFERGSL